MGFQADEFISTGTWGDVRWELFRARRLPDGALCTAAGCVAIRDVLTREVVLTYNPGRELEDDTVIKAGWEILGGHLDPIDPNDPEGPKESPELAVQREALEEGGFRFHISQMGLFAYRKIYNPRGGRSSPYPPVAYYPFYWAVSDQALVRPTDPEEPATGTFSLDALNVLVTVGAMEATERDIVRLGLQAYRTEAYL